MAGAAFNPDQYLNEIGAAPQQAAAFNPDQYLNEIGATGKASKAASKSAPVAEEDTGVVRSFTDHVANGAAFGYMPQAVGGITKLLSPSEDDIKSVVREDIRNKPGKDVSYNPYLIGRDATTQTLDQEQADHPIASTTGTVGGAIGSAMVLPVPGFLASKGVAQGAGLAAKVGQSVMQGAKVGAVYGAAANPGDKEGEISPLQLKERGQNAIDSAKFGGMIGGSAPVVGQAFKSTFNASKPAAQWAAQKVGRVFADVPEATTARYIENPNAINSAPTRENISDKVLALKQNAQDQLEHAQQKLADAKSSVNETKGDTRAGLQDQKFDTYGKLQEAQQAFNEKKQSYKEALKNHNLTSMAGDVVDSIGDLKDQVVKGSKEAYRTLFNANGSIETKPLVNVLENHIQSNLVNGVPPTQDAANAIQEIKGMQDRLGQMGDKISMPQAKQILQALDKSIDYGKGSGTFLPQTDEAFSSMRHYLDSDVKARVPQYKEQMADVARQTRLLGSANDHFGTPEKAISNLNSITSQRGQAVHLPIIEALGKETGKDLTAPVNKYLETHKILTTPSLFEQAVDQLPEANNLRKAQLDMSRIQDPAYSRDITEGATSPVQNKVTQAQNMADYAKERAQKFNGITSQSITSKTKALGGANNYGAEATLRPIDETYGTDFQKQIQARNDLDHFNKDTTNGSRKANIGKGLGAGIGAALTQSWEGAVGGGAVGGAVGGAMDKYAGKVFKSGLDKGMSIGSAIDRASANGNPNLTNRGIRAMIPNTAPQINTPAAASSDENKGPEKWAKDGFQNLKGHVSDDDRKFLEDKRSAMMFDPKAKQLLMTASSYQPGSKPLDDIMKHLKNQYGSKNK